MSGKSGHLALLKYLNGQWITIVETGRDSQISSQALVSSDDGFPHDRVTKLIETGKRVVKVAFGEKTWMVLMQENTEAFKGALEQRISFSKSFPDSEIQGAWKEGRRVQFIDYLDSQWVLVTETAPSHLTVGQKALFATEALPGSLLKADFWEKDKNLTCLSFAEETGWVMIGEYRSESGQAYTAGSDWPKEKVLARLNDRMNIADVSWTTKDHAWAIVFDQTPTNLGIGTSIHFDKTFPEDLMRTLQLTRYGKRF